MESCSSSREQNTHRKIALSRDIFENERDLKIS